jgi:hypothetical protein
MLWPLISLPVLGYILISCSLVSVLLCHALARYMTSHSADYTSLSFTIQFFYTTNTLYQKFETNIPRNETVLPRSQYSQKNRSQIHE